jgi:hypothetical protein
MYQLPPSTCISPKYNGWPSSSAAALVPSSTPFNNNNVAPLSAILLATALLSAPYSEPG